MIRIRQQRSLARSLQACSARGIGEVPVGCVLVHDNRIIARGSNRTNETRNVSLPCSRLAYCSRWWFWVLQLDSRWMDRLAAHLPVVPLPLQATRHAEFEAIDQVLTEYGREQGEAILRQCDLYVSCEPCIMCAGALSLLGIRRVFYGCGNDKFGGCGSVMSVNERGAGFCGK